MKFRIVHDLDMANMPQSIVINSKKLNILWSFLRSDKIDALKNLAEHWKIPTKQII